MIEIECVDFLTLRPSEHTRDEFETADLTPSLREPERDVAEARRRLEAAGAPFAR